MKTSSMRHRKRLNTQTMCFWMSYTYYISVLNNSLFVRELMVDHPLDDAVIQGIKIGTASRPHHNGDMILKIFGQPLVGHVRNMGGNRDLLQYASIFRSGYCYRVGFVLILNRLMSSRKNHYLRTGCISSGTKHHRTDIQSPSSMWRIHATLIKSPPRLNRLV